ncbi:MAG: acetylxylan esterase [Cytophagales bacterium]|nr:acetylxylan esterase [Cytophagales bacterium]
MIKSLSGFLLICFPICGITGSCLSKKEISVLNYYEYDEDLPLEDSVNLLSDSSGYKLFYTEFTSTHNKRVTGLLSIPLQSHPLPVIILLHGLGDRKTVDYIEAGHEYFVNAGYAVMRIDIANHGDREEQNFDFDLTGSYRYWTRDMLTQTVFDLRRSIDFLRSRDEIDSGKIGFYGISLGGVIGTIFCGVDERVKAPVIALAGGNLSLMFGTDALTEDVREFFSVIDPINYVREIAPRPLLMINAENDEVIAPITSKLLFNKAESPKKIIWYPSRHRNLPIDRAYSEGIEWFEKYL